MVKRIHYVVDRFFFKLFKIPNSKSPVRIQRVKIVDKSIAEKISTSSSTYRYILFRNTHKEKKGSIKRGKGLYVR